MTRSRSKEHHIQELVQETLNNELSEMGLQVTEFSAIVSDMEGVVMRIKVPKRPKPDPSPDPNRPRCTRCDGTGLEP